MTPQRIALGLLLVAGLLYWQRPQRVAFWKLKLTPSRSNTQATQGCFRKNKCLVVYVAPWCPNCEVCIGGLTEVAKQLNGSANSGIMVMIGGDEPEKLEAMAEKIGPNTFVDADSSWHRELKIRGVPSWKVLAADGRVLKTAAGAPEVCDASFIEQLY